MIYFTSDLHLYHNKEFLFRPRGFDSIEDMVNCFIKNYNETIKEDDDVYILGDLMLNDNEKGIEVLKNLKGKIHIIIGNHDTDTRVKLYKELPSVVEVVYATMIRYSGYRFYLSHYPTLTSNLDEKDLKQQTINLYGHTHQKMNFFDDNPAMYHVGLDSHDMKLVSIEQIIEDCKKKIAEEIAKELLAIE